MVAGAAHLCEDFVQPLQGTVQVDLNPARSRGHVLSVVFRAPALHKGHPGGKYFQSGCQSKSNDLPTLLYTFLSAHKQPQIHD